MARRPSAPRHASAFDKSTVCLPELLVATNKGRYAEFGVAHPGELSVIHSPSSHLFAVVEAVTGLIYWDVCRACGVLSAAGELHCSGELLPLEALYFAEK